MRCRTCDYALWNLRTRVCPECGSPFSIGDYELVPASVRFCCPHCNQSYYGMDAKGHLAPREFDCVSCGRPVTMEEMVVLPAEGLRDQDTSVIVPWMMRRERGVVSSWIKTVGWGFAYGPQIGRGLASIEPGRSSFVFAFATIALPILVIFSPMMCFMLPGLMGGGGGGGVGAGGALQFFGILLACMIVFAALGLWLGAFMAHGMMRMLSSGSGGFDRTLGAVCFSCGPILLSAVPCLGFYIFPVSWIWWMVSASLALAEAHRDRVWKGVVSMLIPALLVPGVPIAAYAVLIMSMMGGAGIFSGAAFTGQISTQVRVSSLTMAWRSESQQQPAAALHAASLMQSGFVQADTFLIDGTTLSPDEIAVGALTLADFQNIAGRSLNEPQQSAIAEAVAALPLDVIAHRLGDFVFTYHGIDQTTASQELWVVIAAPLPDPAAPPGPAATIVVGKVGSGTEAIALSNFAASLQAQNDLRARYNLAPLPMPETITHEQPALAGDQ